MGREGSGRPKQAALKLPNPIVDTMEVPHGSLLNFDEVPIEMQYRDIVNMVTISKHMYLNTIPGRSH